MTRFLIQQTGWTDALEIEAADALEAAREFAFNGLDEGDPDTFTVTDPRTEECSTWRYVVHEGGDQWWEPGPYDEVIPVTR